ncbi:hypothetical protein [Streptomyces sp. NPDC046859]|uniref:hypothetical protein n=1 Tax=Streptomyces sp. NPDC046859 TaxID=3155734 RepID=UPI0033F1EC98
MKKWREDAQPEWPQAAYRSVGSSSAGGAGVDTQAFPATGETGLPGRGPRSRTEARETDILQGGRRASTDADKTEILRGVPAASGDETAVLPGVGRPAGPPRHAVGHTDPFAAGGPRTAPVRDPWAEHEQAAGPEGTGATHDPHEVTVQLDGIGLQLDGMLRAAKDAPGTPEGSDGPVFVDETGRRSRRFRRLGMAVALACAVYAVVIVATLLSGNSDAPWVPVEGPREKPAGQVDTSPLPAESVTAPSETSDVSPGASPSASAGESLLPGTGGTASGASADAQDPAGSGQPKPGNTKATSNPGSNPTPDRQTPTNPVTDNPAPSPTDGGGTTTEPTDPTTTEDPGTGTVAHGPSNPEPVAQETGGTASAPAAPFPENTF